MLARESNALDADPYADHDADQSADELAREEHAVMRRVAEGQRVLTPRARQSIPMRICMPITRWTSLRTRLHVRSMW